MAESISEETGDEMDSQSISLSKEQMAQEREEWLHSITALMTQVKTWANAQGWDRDDSDTEIHENPIGSYTLPVLTIATPWGRVVIEPVARFVIGAKGRVDLYAWPTLNRVILLRNRNNEWVIRTESGLVWPQHWEEATFVDLVQNLLGSK